MARSLVLGNGGLLVCYDEWGQVRDLYFPYVGQENHVGEQLMHRIGVFADGGMHWLSSGEFAITIAYEPDTLVGHVHAVHDALKLELHFTDVVYNEHDIFVRQVTVVNRAKRDRSLKLFFNQQFHISESRHGDTGYFAPELHALVHYKGKRIFVVSARTHDAFFDEYSVGLLGIEGREGTWCDANDGVLSKNAIEHGSVDSVLGISLFLKANSERYVSYWIAAARTYRTALRYHRDILARGPSHLVRTTADFWSAWVKRTDFEACSVPGGMLDEYKRSLLVMRTHTDNHGAVLASCDSSMLQSGRDTYCYSWPRDAAYIVTAFLRAGHVAPSENFHTFCNDVLTDDGYLLHKYRPDHSLGSSWHPWVRDGRVQPPIQEDETAITLVSLGEHYETARDIEYIERLYNPYIKRVADFLTRYRDRTTGLPLPSYDLWEERFGTFTYTASSVYAALRTAAQFANILGKHIAERRWNEAAESVRQGILTHLVREGSVVKSIHAHHGEVEVDATPDASSLYGLFRFGVLEPTDQRLRDIYEWTKQSLTVPGGLGIARYVGDQYFRRVAEVPGNPWVITTLWFAEYETAIARTDGDLGIVRDRLDWILAHANDGGLLAEEYDPETGEPASASPLAWSHAQYVIAFLAYVAKLQTLGLCPLDVPSVPLKKRQGRARG